MPSPTPAPPQARPPLVIVQFGLPYSPNVGDGIIAECLAWALRTGAPGTEVRMVDLSGRGDFGEVALRHRALALRLLQALPRPLRARLVEARLNRMLDRVAPAWWAAAEGADLAIVGGGQLLSDADLNFPVKLARAAAILRASRRPTAIHAAGAARNWSPRGRALFGDLLATDLRLVGLRDAPSAAAWVAQMPATAPPPAIARDPGLLAAACYGTPQGAAGAAPARVGLCVTAPQVLRYHADRPTGSAAMCDGRFFVELAAALCAAGHRVALFCNGASEDAAALRAVAGDGAVRGLVAGGGVAVLPVPRRPAELAHLVAGLRAVVAHRLHACIVGYSYGLPVVGLGWDGKVEAFFEAIAAPDRFLAAQAVSVGAVRDRLSAALAEGIDRDTHRRIVGEAREGVARLLALAKDSAAEGRAAPSRGGPAHASASAPVAGGADAQAANPSPGCDRPPDAPTMTGAGEPHAR